MPYSLILQAYGSSLYLHLTLNLVSPGNLEPPFMDVENALDEKSDF